MFQSISGQPNDWLISRSSTLWHTSCAVFGPLPTLLLLVFHFSFWYNPQYENKTHIYTLWQRAVILAFQHNFYALFDEVQLYTVQIFDSYTKMFFTPLNFSSPLRSMGPKIWIYTKLKTVSITEPHHRATAKPAACAKLLMLSTPGSKGKRGGRVR